MFLCCTDSLHAERTPRALRRRKHVQINEPRLTISQGRTLIGCIWRTRTLWSREQVEYRRVGGTERLDHVREQKETGEQQENGRQVTDDLEIQDLETDHEDGECDRDQRLARRLAAQDARQLLLQVSLLLFCSPHRRASVCFRVAALRRKPFATMKHGEAAKQLAAMN